MRTSQEPTRKIQLEIRSAFNHGVEMLQKLSIGSNSMLKTVPLTPVLAICPGECQPFERECHSYLGKQLAGNFGFASQLARGGCRDIKIRRV